MGSSSGGTGSGGSGKSERDQQKDSFAGITGGVGIGGYDSTKGGTGGEGGKGSTSSDRGAQKDAFGGIVGGEALGGYNSTLGRGLGGESPADSRAAQKASFAGIVGGVALGNPNTGLTGTKQTSYTTVEEAEALGGTTFAGYTGARARALGLDINTETGRLSETSLDVSKFVGGVFGEDYDVDAATFSRQAPDVQADIAAGLKEGTIKAGKKGVGVQRSAIGVLGEVANLGASAFGAVATAGALTAAGFTAAAAPSVAKTGYGLIGAVQDVANLASRQASLVGAGLLGDISNKPSAPRSGGEGVFGGFEEEDEQTPTKQITNPISPIQQVQKPKQTIAVRGGAQRRSYNPYFASESLTTLTPKLRGN